MENKKVILAICGSIAAYKAAFLTRLLIKSGAEVQVLMTPAATHFIRPLTLATLSKRPVHVDVIDGESWNDHVALGLWADAMVIAPATANTLAKLATGICDTIVSAVYLSARCPVFFAPAMDLDMWKHPATKANVDRLMGYGNHLIPVEHGELASGLTGEGRMAEPETITQHLRQFFQTDPTNHNWTGKRVMITAGPTFEAIDPVRFIGNHSSGKMGVALAECLAERGAEVALILGPSQQQTRHARIHVHRVTSASEMLREAEEHYPDCDVAILAAAVADFRPADIAAEKIKKQPGQTGMTLTLVRTPDIAATLGQRKRNEQINVGFALETENRLANARGKLERKNFDLIVLNSPRDEGAGFGHDTNKVTLIGRDNKAHEFELKTKREVAEDIADAIEALFDR